MRITFVRKHGLKAKGRRVQTRHRVGDVKDRVMETLSPASEKILFAFSVDHASYTCFFRHRGFDDCA
jgi:hypothetical protein